MPKVYVVQEDPKKNILPAREYGDIVVLHGQGQISLDTNLVEDTIDDMADKLTDYKQEDSLLLIGDPVLIAVAASIISHLTNGIYSVLKWDRQERTYIRITLDLGNA